MTKRALATLALLVTLGSASTGLPQGNRPGQPGGGTTPTCPANTLTFFPATSAELQTAIECAEPGATITLRSGSANVYQGSFTLRHKAVAYEADGTTPKRITIQSDQASALPADVRVNPSQEETMAWLVVPPGSADPVLTTELKTLADATRRGASHYRFAGIKFATTHWVNHLVRLGTATEKSAAELPADIAFDRSYLSGSAGEGTKQGLVANGRDVIVTNSYFKDFKDTANDALAIAIWNGSGPYVVVNNYLEASGENMMAGGADPTIANLVPSDITVRWNHFFKPTAWTYETSTQAGTAFGKTWRVKNLFELKNAERVLVEGNVFENNWIQADQHGFAVQLTPRNQGGGCRWCRVWDVTFRNNLVRNSTAGINLVVTDDLRQSGQLLRVTVRNNLLVNINGDAVPGTPTGDRAGRLLQIFNPSTRTQAVSLTVDRNTAFSSREISFSGGKKTSGISLTNNVARHNPCTQGNNCGISGNNTAPGTPSITAWFGAPYEVTGNVFFDAGRDRAADYPSGNSFPASVTFTTAIDQVTGLPLTSDPDYTVVDSNGTAVGADWSVLKTHIDVATSGTPPAQP